MTLQSVNGSPIPYGDRIGRRLIKNSLIGGSASEVSVNMMLDYPDPSVTRVRFVEEETGKVLGKVRVDGHHGSFGEVAEFFNQAIGEEGRQPDVDICPQAYALLSDDSLESKAARLGGQATLLELSLQTADEKQSQDLFGSEDLVRPFEGKFEYEQSYSLLAAAAESGKKELFSKTATFISKRGTGFFQQMKSREASRMLRVAAYWGDVEHFQGVLEVLKKESAGSIHQMDSEDVAWILDASVKSGNEENFREVLGILKEDNADIYRSMARVLEGAAQSGSEEYFRKAVGILKEGDARVLEQMKAADMVVILNSMAASGNLETFRGTFEFLKKESSRAIEQMDAEGLTEILKTVVEAGNFEYFQGALDQLKETCMGALQKMDRASVERIFEAAQNSGISEEVRAVLTE